VYLLVAPRAHEFREVTDELRMLRKLVDEFIQKKITPNHARCCQLLCHDADAWAASGRIGILLADEHAGYGYMTENPIAHTWVVSHEERICSGASETMKEVTGTSR